MSDRERREEHEIAYAAGTLDDGTYGERAYCATCSALARDYIEDCAIRDQLAAHNSGPLACSRCGKPMAAHDEMAHCKSDSQQRAAAIFQAAAMEECAPGCLLAVLAAAGRPPVNAAEVPRTLPCHGLCGGVDGCPVPCARAAHVIAHPSYQRDWSRREVPLPEHLADPP